MGSNQIKIGTEYEVELAKWLKNHKFWAYNMPRKTNGQPCDIVAIKNNTAILMDAKHVRKEEISFPFSRIEPNQISSFAYAKGFANISYLGFAIFFERENEWFWLPYDEFVKAYSFGEKSVNKELLITLEEFINEHFN